MTEFSIDVDAYLARIGFEGARDPSLQTLQRIILLHQLSIAFENLDSFAGLPVLIDPPTIEDKIIHRGRGGYCYEQNQYLGLALTALGFDVRLRMARVRWMLPPERIPQRGHMLLNVAAGGRWYLCDVAFGAMTPTAPLLLDTTDQQDTPHQPYRVVPKDDALHLEVRLGEHWRPVYSFDTLDHYPVDFEAVNWQVSTHPASEFVTSLIVARPTGDRRLILTNTGLSTRHSDGRVEKRMLADTDELRTMLGSTFGIRLPGSNAVDHALDRLFAGTVR